MQKLPLFPLLYPLVFLDFALYGPFLFGREVAAAFHCRPTWVSGVSSFFAELCERERELREGKIRRKNYFPISKGLYFHNDISIIIVLTISGRERVSAYKNSGTNIDWDAESFTLWSDPFFPIIILWKREKEKTSENLQREQREKKKIFGLPALTIVRQT